MDSPLSPAPNDSTARCPLRGDTTRYGNAYQAIKEIVTDPSHASTAYPEFHVAFRRQNGTVGNRDFATHWIHSYPAKMFHRIPRQLLSALDPNHRTTVLDPFCGSGTVLLEAAMLGYQALGIDVNPLARLISTVKSTRIPPSRLEVLGDELLARADKGSPSYQLNPYLTDWFKPHATKALANLMNAISEVHDPASRNFFLVTLSSIIRRCSLADPSIPPPVKLNPRRAPRANPRYRRNLVSAMALTEATVYEQFRKAMSNNIRRINELGNLRNFGSVAILEPLAEAAGTTLPSDSVDVILTSPPYCGAQKYVRTLRLELCWLGYTDEEIARLDRNTLGTERVRSLAKII